jgi:hypothetical protein
MQDRQQESMQLTSSLKKTNKTKEKKGDAVMLRKLLSTIAVAGMLTGVLAGSASAGLFSPVDSRLTIALGALEPMVVFGTYANPGWATLSNNNGAHDLTDSSSVWVTTNMTVGTSLLTGVAFITNLTLTMYNGAGTFTRSWSSPNQVGGNATFSASSATLCPLVGTCLGGNNEELNGFIIVGLAGGGIPVALNQLPVAAFGVGGKMNINIGAGIIALTNGPFLTGKAVITGLTTNLIQLPGRADGPQQGVGVTLRPNATEEVRTFTTGLGFITSNPDGILEVLATVVVSGSNTVSSASQSGMVTLVSPMRVDTGALVGIIPAVIIKKFTFIPEPATALLLVSGAAGLVFIGHRRRSKKG